MVEIEGMSVVDAAKKLGMSCVTTHKAIDRVRKKLIAAGHQHLGGEKRQDPGT
jgi:DNA-directed RNA polymerase specialized sigma24 family protein